MTTDNIRALVRNRLEQADEALKAVQLSIACLVNSPTCSKTSGSRLR